jgi:hypothetical protein
MDSANAVLLKFIADYNRSFARQPREMQTARSPAPESLDRICCFLHEHIVSNHDVRAVGRPPLPDPPTSTPLQLRRRQGDGWVAPMGPRVCNIQLSQG